MTMPTRQKTQKRNYEIYQHYLDGLTITDISKIYHLSRQAIHSIVKEAKETIDLTNN